MRQHFISFRSLLALTLVLLSASAKTQDYTFIWEQYTSEFDEFPVGFTSVGNATVKCLTVDDRNAFWIGTYRTGVVRFYQEDAGDYELYNYANLGLEGNEIYHITAPTINTIWFSNYNDFGATFDGLYEFERIDFEDGNLRDLHGFYDIDSEYVNLHKVEIEDLVKVSTAEFDYVWVATNQGVLIGKPGDTLYHHPEISNHIISIAQDSNLVTYALGANGFLKVEGSGVKSVRLKDYETELGIFNPIKVNNGPGDTIWILTSKGIIKQHYNDTVLTYNKVISSKEIHADSAAPVDIAFDSLQNPWIIFDNNGGIVYLDYHGTGRKFHINSLNSAPTIPDEPRLIFADRDGQIWIGTDNDGLFLAIDKTPISIQKPIELSLNFYPNPSDNYTIINLPLSVIQTSEISVYSPLGKKVIGVEIDGNQIQLPKLTNGLYTVVLRGTNSYRGTLMIQQQ